MNLKTLFKGIGIVAPILLLSATPALGSENTEAIKTVQGELQNNINIVWTLVAAILVFFMQAGFALVEIGFTRSKNAINIIMKNLMDFAVGSLVFFIIGFGLMFGKSNGLFGTTDFMLGMDVISSPEHWNWTFLIFQTVFAGTAATIVSGAMAERTRFKSYLVYSVFISAFIYPIFGSWAWGGLLHGGGWLENLSSPFVDFAGSTVVHSIGGWLALAGAIIVGPRIGKYGKDGKAKAIPGHNVSMAALGVFILWFGWFGFNSGSTTVGNGEIGRIAITTNLAAAAGAISAMVTAWLMFKKPDASMALNGTLAGLVGITAGCYTVTPMGAIVIGLVAGILVVLSVEFIDKILKIDDPVGAVSVHAVNGAWGTLAAGLFGAEKILGVGKSNTGLFYGGGLDQTITQIIGILAAFVWAFGLGLLLFFVTKKLIGLRVTKEDEMKGLDLTEHGMEAYSGFQIFND